MSPPHPPEPDAPAAAAPMDHAEVERLRAATPGLADGIHLNHAGASPNAARVVDTVVDHLRLEAAIGGYEAEAQHRDEIDAVYASVARLIGCGTDEVAITPSATVAWESAFWAYPWASGDVLLASRAEYVSNGLSLLTLARRRGVDVRIVADDETGAIDLDELARGLEDPAVKLVALTHVPTHCGLVNPAAAVGALCRQAGVVFLLDACQSIGQMPVDVDRIGCDVLSATGRKFLRAPRGTGFLYVRSSALEVMEPVFADAGSATWDRADAFTYAPGARRFELYERSFAAMLGLGAAVDDALAIGLDRIRDRVHALGEGFRSRLGEVPGVTVQDTGTERCGIVSFTVAGHDADDVQRALAAAGVKTWVTRAGHARFDMDRRHLTTMVRASLHYVTTDDELDRAAAELERIVA